MQEGYDYLEQGKWQQAQDYFQEILQTYPQNKTANLCYNRALGLNGNPELASQGFSDMLLMYPDDYELQLNLAESYMWQKKYMDATRLYEQLCQSTQVNEVALMGYANALSKHDASLALSKINEALFIKPDFEAAKISKKYILLTLASEAKHALDFQQAEYYARQAVDLFPSDNETRITLAQLKQIQNFPRKANKLFFKMNNEKLVFDRDLGLSYSYILLQRNKKAAAVLDGMRAMPPADPAQQKRLDQSYLNMLAIQNSKVAMVNAAQKYVQDYNDSAYVALTDLRAVFWQGKPYAASQLASNYVQKFPKDAMGYITLADIQLSMQQRKLAEQSIGQALQLEPAEIGAQLLQKRIKRAQKSLVNLAYYYESDEDVTSAGQFNISYENFHLDAWDFGLGYKSRNATNTSTDAKAANHHIYGNLRYHWRGSLVPSAYVGYAFQNPVSNAAFIYDFSLDYKLKKILTTSLGYRKSLVDYSTDLIDAGIYTNDLYFNNNVLTKFGLGWYLQLISSTQTDDNKRFLMFTSLYYNIFKIPLIQTGVNFNYMSFDTERSDLYFSPSAYNFVEAFIKLRNIDKLEAKLIYEVLLSIGTQKIHESDAQRMLRAEINLGYRLSTEIELLAYYQYSNSSYSTVAGFTFNKFGVKLSSRLPFL